MKDQMPDKKDTLIMNARRIVMKKECVELSGLIQFWDIQNLKLG